MVGRGRSGEGEELVWGGRGRNGEGEQLVASCASVGARLVH